jgi:hypothetical protein
MTCPYGIFGNHKLTQPLPVFSTAFSLDQPWLLILADGAQCLQVTGATIDLAGIRNSYYCGKSNDSLYGTVNKADPVWTIYDLRNGSSNMTQAAIAKAYY